MDRKLWLLQPLMEAEGPMQARARDVATSSVASWGGHVALQNSFRELMGLSCKIGIL